AGRDTLVASGETASTMAAVRHNQSLVPNRQGAFMSITTQFLRRDPADVQPWAETCGQIRCLIEAKDGAAGEVHHVEIHDAKLHYHERTDEFYYVIDGHGTMVLDDEEIELHPGVVVYIPRGVKHKARGDIPTLPVCIPPGVLTDIPDLNKPPDGHPHTAPPPRL